jgi:Fic family protein
MAVRGKNRAGQYVRQPRGYRAFIPTRLPPDPPLQIGDDLWMYVSKADRALARLDMTSEIIPDPDMFVTMYVRREAVLSSQIEGTQASLMDVLEYEARAVDPSKKQDVGEVINYINAMRYGLARLAKLPVSLRLIKEIHGRLLEKGRGHEKSPGEFRRTQNWIGATDCLLSEALFVPPPPHEMEKALGELELFIYDKTPMPVLIKLGLVHAQFETIHPFIDGNGRMGRLLITFLLCENEILRQPLLYLSYFFKKRRAEYYDRLQAVRDGGDWEGWLRFFLDGVYEVSREATDVARRIMRLREEHRGLMTERMGRSAARGLKLLEALFRSPFVSVAGIAEATGLSVSNANALAARCVDLGILEEATGQKRNRAFVYSSYLSLFEDEFDEEASIPETSPTVRTVKRKKRRR